MSIDAPSAEIKSDKENTDNFNYIDTYVEYVAEVIFKYNNAIPESGHREQKVLMQHRQFEIIFQAVEFQKPVRLAIVNSQNNNPSYTDNYSSRYTKEINPPPPKFF